MKNKDIESISDDIAITFSHDRRSLVKLVAFLTREIASIEGDSFDQVLAEVGYDCDTIYCGELEE